MLAFECEVIFDTKRIAKENIDTLEKIQKATDKVFADFGYVKGKKGFYRDDENEGEFLLFADVLDYLEKQSWFLRYVKKVRYHNRNML